MTSIRITKHLDSETLVLPEIRPLIGRTVEIHVSAEPESLDELIDREYLDELLAEEAAEQTPPPTIDEIRTILSKIPGNMSDDIREDREERA